MLDHPAVDHPHLCATAVTGVPSDSADEAWADEAWADEACDAVGALAVPDPGVMLVVITRSSRRIVGAGRR